MSLEQKDKQEKFFKKEVILHLHPTIYPASQVKIQAKQCIMFHCVSVP